MLLVDLETKENFKREGPAQICNCMITVCVWKITEVCIVKA